MLKEQMQSVSSSSMSTMRTAKSNTRKLSSNDEDISTKRTSLPAKSTVPVTNVPSTSRHL